MKRRIVAGFGANTFGRISTALIQVISVPVFLTHWGTSLYGEWILLNAIPGYLLMSDIGFGTVAGNDMTMLIATGEREQALTVFQSVWVLITVLSAACMLLVLGGIWFVPIDRWFHLRALSANDARCIVIALSLSVLLGMQETLFQAAFRCVGKYPFGTIVKNIIMLVSFCAVIGAVVLRAHAVVAALVLMLVNCTGTFIFWLLLRRNITWIRFGVKYATYASIYRLASPAISFMCSPLGTALNLQGMLVVVGHFLGPIGVVTFNTARTLSRSAYQAMQLINNSVWPEMSAAFGAGDVALARRLHRRSCQISIALCLCTILGATVCGDWIWRTWTLGRLRTDPILLDILLLQMLIAALWFTSSVVPASINRYQGVAKLIITTTVFSLLAAWLLVQTPNLELRGAAISLVLGDAIMALFVLKQSLKLLDDNLTDFMASMLTLPKLR